MEKNSDDLEKAPSSATNQNSETTTPVTPVVNEQASELASQSAPQLAPLETKKNKTGKLIVWIMGLLFLFGIGGVAIYATIESNKPENILLSAIVKASKQTSFETTLEFNQDNFKKVYKAGSMDEQVINLISNTKLKVLSQIDSKIGLLKSSFVLKSADKEIGNLRFELNYKELKEFLFKVRFSDELKQIVRSNWLQLFLSQLDSANVPPAQRKQIEQDIATYANEMFDDFEQLFVEKWLALNLAFEEDNNAKRCFSTIIDESLANQLSDSEMLHAYKNHQVLTVINEKAEESDDNTLAYDVAINYQNVDKFLESIIDQNKVKKIAAACSELSTDEIDAPKNDEDDFQELLNDLPKNIRVYVHKGPRTISHIAFQSDKTDSLVHTMTIRFGVKLPEDEPKDPELFTNKLRDFGLKYPEFIEGVVEGYNEATYERDRQNRQYQIGTDLFDETMRNLF